MPQKNVSAFALGALALSAGLLLTQPGCEHRPPDELARAVYMGERQVAMRGDGMFFDGKISALVTISRGIGRGYAKTGKGKKSILRADARAGEEEKGVDADLSRMGRPDQNRPLGMGGGESEAGNMQSTPGGMGGSGYGGAPNMGGMGGMGNMNTPVGIDPSLGSADSQSNGESDYDEIKNMNQEEAMAYLRKKHATSSPMPPVTLHLRLGNLAPEVVSVEIRTFESELGNFAVRPDVVKIASRQVGEPEPMISQMGVSSDAIPVKVTLKLGGKTETKVILVKSLLEEEPGRE